MIGIIGAGISGLALAYELQKKRIPYFLLEATGKVGGYLQSEKIGNYQLDYGANSLLCDQQILQWIEEIGLKSEIVSTNPVSKNRYIFRNGAYQILPASPPQLIFSNFFSWKTKWRVFQERNKKAEPKTNESLASFFRRRFSQEIVDYALNPFVSGIYAGNPEDLLLEKTFPMLAEYEQKYGSVLKGFIKNKGGARRQSINFRNGMNTLPQKLAELVKENLRLNTPIEKIEKNDKKWKINELECEKLVITSPAFVTAKLLQTTFPDFSNALEKVNYPPMCVVYTAFKKQDVHHQLNGFGGLHPKIEHQFSAGSIWSSSVFPDRCPADEVLFTSFVGGMQYAENAQLTDNLLLEKLNGELKKNYQIKGNPVFQKIFRWEKAIPQYNTHINQVYEQAKHLEQENIFICANWKDGVSVADCIKKAIDLATVM